ncbi:MAG: hypothetical protein Q9214_001343 [Letrouitia sp. 1 TL-2023]
MSSAKNLRLEPPEPRIHFPAKQKTITVQAIAIRLRYVSTVRKYWGLSVATARTGDVVLGEAASTVAKAMLLGFIPVPKCPFPLRGVWYPDRQLDLLQRIPRNLHDRNRDADELRIRDEIK